MIFLRRILPVVLCLVLLQPLTAAAAELEGEQAIVRDLIGYYFHYRDKAAGEIDNQLQILSSIDPAEGEKWCQLMDTWQWINAQMHVNTAILPDGLPQDDSLCIVVLGYGLKKDGEMKRELLDRLEVALASAKKYPESYVLCTGGETSDVPGISEAGQMGAWLLEKGLPHNRLILEEDSLSTTANAQNCLRLLWRDYPQVKTFAIVSSDYHIRWGTACFSAMNLLHGGERQLELAGNAACVTASPDRDTMYSQAWGISIIADVPFDSSYVPLLYMTEQAAPTEEPDTSPEVLPVQSSKQTQPPVKEPVVPVLLGLTAVVLVLFAPKKHKKRGSD